MGNNILKINKKMKEAIERSGYLMEQEIAKFMKQEKFLVAPNYSFRDTETDSSKEIDILAILFDDIVTDEGYVGYIYFYLVIEVKNIEPVVCFTHYDTSNTGFFHFSGVPKYIWNKQNKEKDLLDFLEINKFHHYYRIDKIATQFCIISEKRGRKSSNQEYRASHHFGNNRNLYEELVVPLIKIIEYEKEINKNILEFDQPEPIHLFFYYPIAVVKGLFECCAGDVEPIYKKVQKVNFVRRYVSKKISGSYRIDICDKKGLERIIKSIKNEFKITKKHIQNNYKLYVKSALKEYKDKTSIYETSEVKVI